MENELLGFLAVPCIPDALKSNICFSLSIDLIYDFFTLFLFVTKEVSSCPCMYPATEMSY